MSPFVISSHCSVPFQPPSSHNNCRRTVTVASESQSRPCSLTQIVGNLCHNLVEN
ncbi:hypothetical protein MtrunA17_Chr8g0386151 [Medicago truncatula]|uniref:Uncharacterized protein n=1 Tax=Medicago truncatula TaxID=3880 RepID=A0A072TV07_MEDTR|nr:hypothetical protein MTR_8g096540 [Medicago truncatula]RHN43285.1 hypothetical protein MtrunA17_Chr8g0386151 [Medicago truncatula]